MTNSQKDLVQNIAIVLAGLLLAAAFLFLYRYLSLPSAEEIIAWAQVYYAKYGYWVVLLGAIAEGTLFVNWYLPGSIVVVMGVVFSRQNSLNVFLVVALIILGFFATAVFNYALGRFGWYNVFLKMGLEGPLNKIRSRVEKYGLKALLTTYIHPNLGALAATSAGILHLPFWKFLSFAFISVVFWNSLWGIVAYNIGPIILKYLNGIMTIAAMCIFASWLVYSTVVKKREEKQNGASIPKVP